MAYVKDHILIADDDAEDYMILREALDECCQNRIEWVKDGEELLAHLERNPSPSLLLLDLNMPRLDGLEALNQIALNKRLENIPIMLLVSSETQETYVKNLQLKVQGYIRKPCNASETDVFCCTLNKYLTRN